MWMILCWCINLSHFDGFSIPAIIIQSQSVGHLRYRKLLVNVNSMRIAKFFLTPQIYFPGKTIKEWREWSIHDELNLILRLCRLISVVTATQQSQSGRTKKVYRGGLTAYKWGIMWIIGNMWTRSVQTIKWLSSLLCVRMYDHVCCR